DRSSTNCRPALAWTDCAGRQFVLDRSSLPRRRRAAPWDSPGGSLPGPLLWYFRSAPAAVSEASRALRGIALHARWDREGEVLAVGRRPVAAGAICRSNRRPPSRNAISTVLGPVELALRV